MFNYRLIVEYHEKGNNNSQIATLCNCQRKTVIKILKIAKERNICYKDIVKLTDKQVYWLFYPKNEKRKEEYLQIDFKWEEFQMCKHQSSVRLCWRRYCKRAIKQGLKAYTWSTYLTMYAEYKKPQKAKKMDKIRNRVENVNILLKLFRNPEGRGYKQMEAEKNRWLKSLHLQEEKIIDVKKNDSTGKKE